MKSSLIITILSLVTILLSFAVQVALAAILGTTREMDVYFIAITIPVTAMVAFQLALSFSMVPVVKSHWVAGRPEEARYVFSIVLNVVTLAALIIFGLGAIWSEALAPLLAPGFEAKAIHLAQAILPLFLLATVFDLARSVLMMPYYAAGKFLLPQSAPLVNHAILLVVALFLLPDHGLPAMAWAWFAGSVCMSLMLAPGALRLMGWVPTLNVRSSALREPGRLVLISVGVAILAQLMLVVDRAVASFLDPGSIAYLGYGHRIVELLLRTVPMGLGLSTYPIISALVVTDQLAEIRQIVGRNLRWVILTAMPLAIGLVMVREPLISLLFERGAFDAEATRGVASVLIWYLVGFIPASVTYILSFLIYSKRVPQRLLAISLIGLLLTTVLDLTLAPLLGSQGIAIASFLVATFTLTLVTRVALHLLGGAVWPGRTRWLVKLFAAATAMIAVMILGQRIYPSPGGLIELAVYLAIMLAFGWIAYGGMLLTLRSEEMSKLVLMVKQRFHHYLPPMSTQESG